MSLGLVGRKIGMTRIFTDDGRAVPVTVLDVANNRVTQIKTPEPDGYAAVQVTYEKRRASRVSKPQAGHLAIPGGGLSTLARLRMTIDHQAGALCCTPTYALHLAHAAQEAGIDLAKEARVRVFHRGVSPGRLLPK